LQPRSRSTSHPPQQQDTVHRELRPGTGKGARADAGPLRCAARPAAGPARAPPPPTPAPLPQPLATRSLPTTTGRRKGGHPVVSNRPLHRAMQQRCHHASASARSPCWPTMPRPRLQRAATARREKFQLRIREQSFKATLELQQHVWMALQAVRSRYTEAQGILTGDSSTLMHTGTEKGTPGVTRDICNWSTTNSRRVWPQSKERSFPHEHHPG
jgi:hypothetical protein